MNTLPLPIDGLEIRLRLPVGSLTGPDQAAARQCIDDATSMALDEIPADLVPVWEAALPRTAEVVIYTVARRLWENPSNLSQEISGEHTITTSATSGVFLTPLEVQKIRRAAGLSENSVGTIAIGAPDSPFTPYWWRRRW